MISCLGAQECNGGIAQLARAIGSYPIGRGFKSNFRYHNRPVGQAVKTRPFHGCNMGSIPVRVTKTKKHLQSRCFFVLIPYPMRAHAKQRLADGFASSAQSDARLRSGGKPKDIAAGKFPYPFASAKQMLFVLIP